MTRETIYADRAERLAFNAAQGARRHDGRGVAYVSADNQYSATGDMSPRYRYSPVHADTAVCCSPSAVRMLAHHISRSILVDSDGVTIGLYGPMSAQLEVGGADVALDDETAYPFENDVRVTVSTAPDTTFALRLRVPGWATEVVLDDTSAAHSRREGDHIVVDRPWSGRDVVTVSFVAEIVEHTALDGSVGFSYGALVFAWPIAATEVSVADYPLPGFHDVEYRPTGRESWHLALPFAEGESGTVGEIVTLTPSVAADPFAQPPVALRLPMYDAFALAVEANPVAEQRVIAELVPFGSTRLRRTTFPRMRVAPAAP